MDRVLIDTSTFFDIAKASKRSKDSWAQNTIYNLIRYQTYHPTLTVSAFTVFEHLVGLQRQGQGVEATQFLAEVLPSLEVIYPDEPIIALSAQVHVSLSLVGKTIGVSDAFIAATAIHQKLTLVNANTKHFQRVADLGFPLALENWRDS